MAGMARRVVVRHEPEFVANTRAGGQAFGFLVLFAVFAAPIVFAIKFWYISLPLIALVVGLAWLKAHFETVDARRAREQAEAEAAAAVTAPIPVQHPDVTGRHTR